MIYTIPVKELKIDMYVVMPPKWLDHPLLRNSFLIKTARQLQKIRESGFREMQVDSSFSQAAQDFTAITHPQKAMNSGVVEEPEKKSD